MNTADASFPMNEEKKPLAFLLGITANLAFAAGNVALSLNKYMRDEPYEVVIYHAQLDPADIDAFLKIPNVRLVQFDLPEKFVETMLARMPEQSRFRDVNHLMCFCHFEVFRLLAEYRTVVWLDADVSVQARISEIGGFCPFGITLDSPWPVQNNFSAPIPKYDMSLPGYCTAVMVVGEELPYERIHQWCYEKALEYAEFLINPDQAIINIALQEFGISVSEMPLELWQCISWKDEAITARIVHFGTSSKVWTDTNICSAFPEWYRMHQEWLGLGGSDFDHSRIAVRNALPTLNDFERVRRRIVELEAKEPRLSDGQEREMDRSHNDLGETIKPNRPGRAEPDTSRGEEKMFQKVSFLKAIYLRLGLHAAPAGTLGFVLHTPVRLLHRALHRSPRALIHQAVDGHEDLPPVAIRITGGIGDHLIAARYVRDLVAFAGDFRFDIYSSRVEIAEWVFSRFGQLNGVYNDYLEWDRSHVRYALALWVQQFVILYGDTANWRRLAQHNRKLAKICEFIGRSRQGIDQHVVRHPRSDNFLAQEALLRGANRYTLMHHLSGIPYNGDLLPLDIDPTVLSRWDLTQRTYVTIHNGSDDSLWIDGVPFGAAQSTKAYPHFARVIALLRQEFPGLRIVQIGTKTSRPIPGVDLNLLDKCSIRDSAAIIAGSSLHLDNESGLVHVAACLGVRSCVLFGPTSVEFFSYDTNFNIAPSFCGNCWWLTSTWMKECPRGYQIPRCLDDTTPESVIERIRGYLQKLDRPAEHTPLAVSPMASSHQSSASSVIRKGRDGGSSGVRPAGGDIMADLDYLADVRQRLVHIEDKQNDILAIAKHNADYPGSPHQRYGHITYSQHGEDLVFVALLEQLGVTSPTYLDIGANHPLDCSNTALLYARGARGVNIDASPDVIRLFTQMRPDDKNINVGVAGAAGELTFYRFQATSGRNSFLRTAVDQFMSENTNAFVEDEIKVPVITLDEIILQHCNGVCPDLLSIDAEGMDLEILQATTFPSRPKIICVETISSAGEIGETMDSLLLAKGYRKVVQMFANGIYVDEDFTL